MHPDQYDPPPQVIYVNKPQSATRTTAKALFWLVLLGIGIPMVLCVVGCLAITVIGVGTSGDVGDPAPGVSTVR